MLLVGGRGWVDEHGLNTIPSGKTDDLCNALFSGKGRSIRPVRMGKHDPGNLTRKCSSVSRLLTTRLHVCGTYEVSRQTKHDLRLTLHIFASASHAAVISRANPTSPIASSSALFCAHKAYENGQTGSINEGFYYHVADVRWKAWVQLVHVLRNA